MNDKDKKIIDISNLINEETDVVGIDFFEEMYDLTKSFKEYLSAIRQLKISYFDDVLLKFRDEIDYIVRISKEVSKLEPKKLNSVLDGFTPALNESITRYFSEMVISADELYNIYLRLVDIIQESRPVRSLDFAFYNLYMEQLIVEFILEATTILTMYELFGLKKGKKLREFISTTFELMKYEFNEIGRIETNGVIRADSYVKSEVLYNLEKSDFFTITGKIKHHYKVKFYDIEKDVTIDGFVLKRDVEFSSDKELNESELNDEILNESYEEIEYFVKQYKIIYETDEVMRELAQHVLDYDIIMVRLFEDSINNFRPDRAAFIVETVAKIMMHMEKGDDF